MKWIFLLWMTVGSGETEGISQDMPTRAQCDRAMAAADAAYGSSTWNRKQNRPQMRWACVPAPAPRGPRA